MDYEKLGEAVEAMPLTEQIRVIAELAGDDDYRMFSRAQVWAIEEHKSNENMEAIDAIILSAFKFAQAAHKVGILRSAFSARHCLRYWHNLRDNAHAQLRTETPNSVRIRMTGLYEEFRNAAIIYPDYTPHHSVWHHYPQEHLWPRPRWN